MRRKAISGLTLGDLPAPPKGYRPARDARGGKAVTFEKLGASLKEDERRIHRLEAAFPMLSGDEWERAVDLHRRLAEGVEARIPPRTPASSLYMRNVRNRAIGWVWHLLDQYPDEAKATACLIPATTIDPAGAALRNPKNLMKSLRNEFNRSGITAAAGFLFVGLDVEFDATRGTWHFHYHVVGAGEKIDRLENLKEHRRFEHERRHPLEADMKMYPRIQIERGPFYNEPNAFTYALKAYANHRPSKVRPDAVRTRSKRGRALPDPYHLEWLLWRDSWKIGDFTLLSGMRIAKTGLRITPPGRK